MKKLTTIIATLALALSITTVSAQEVKANKYVLPSAQGITYGGRWDKDDSLSYRVDRGATYLKTDFTGTSVAADIQEDTTRIWWCVSIDGAAPVRMQMEPYKTTVLAQGLKDGKHKLVLERDTEGLAGISRFNGLELDRGANVLPVEQTNQRKLEFVGDSISAGAFARGTGPHGFLTNEGCSLAFGPLLAKHLEADYSVVATSGEGVVHNEGETEPTTRRLYSESDYVQTLYNSKWPLWNPGSNEPQVVILNPGANDFTGGTLPEVSYFTQGYQHFVEVVRHINPHATIICLEPIPQEYGSIAGPAIAEVVHNLNLAGDSKIHYVPVNANGPLLTADDYADGVHPTAAGHAKLVDYLAPIITKLANW